MHGRTSDVHHDAVDLFAGIPNPMTACRYHSLVVDAASLPSGIVVTARDAEGTVMAIADERHRVYGVQFHPESILTRHGFRLLANFLARAGIRHHAAIAAALDADIETQSRIRSEPDVHGADGPIVTF
jgi:anthranilate/para-aminobenzoate synthase component II